MNAAIRSILLCCILWKPGFSDGSLQPSYVGTKLLKAPLAHDSPKISLDLKHNVSSEKKENKSTQTNLSRKGYITNKTASQLKHSKATTINLAIRGQDNVSTFKSFTPADVLSKYLYSSKSKFPNTSSKHSTNSASRNAMKNSINKEKITSLLASGSQKLRGTLGKTIIRLCFTNGIVCNSHRSKELNSARSRKSPTSLNIPLRYFAAITNDMKDSNVPQENRKYYHSRKLPKTYSARSSRTTRNQHKRKIKKDLTVLQIPVNKTTTKTSSYISPAFTKDMKMVNSSSMPTPIPTQITSDSSTNSASTKSKNPFFTNGFNFYVNITSTPLTVIPEPTLGYVLGSVLGSAVGGAATVKLYQKIRKKISKKRQDSKAAKS